MDKISQKNWYTCEANPSTTMALRGSQTLFADIFDIPVAEKQRKGRSIGLHDRRNDCLVDRYFFIAKTTGLRYELVIRILSNEFFLSEYTITDVLDSVYDKVVAVKKISPSKRDLEKKWPHINWDAPIVALTD